MTQPLDDAWPGSPAYVVLRLKEGVIERVSERGDLDDVRSWASVSKLAVALAVGVEFDWELHTPDEIVGPQEATLAHLLSHSSGLGLEEGDPVVPIATKRVYSNYGIDLAVGAIVGDDMPATWLANRIFRPFGMTRTALMDRPASGVYGSTNDLATMAAAWLRPDGIAHETRDTLVTPYLGDLAGIVPGFGRFTPCPWGLGVEVRGAKDHWMGDWPPSSFGHFGQSGALCLVNVDEGIAAVATSTVDFGPWAAALWPAWTSAARSLALTS